MWEPPPELGILALRANKPVLDFVVEALNDFSAARARFSALHRRRLLVSSEPSNAQVYVEGELKGTVGEKGLALRSFLRGHIRFGPCAIRLQSSPTRLRSRQDKEFMAPLERPTVSFRRMGHLTDLLKGGVSTKRVAALVQQRG